MSWSRLFIGLLFTGSLVSRTQTYDPRTDPAYAGYKYRPGQGFTLGAHRLPPKPACIKEVKKTINVSGTFDGQGCLYTFKGTWNGRSYKELCFAPQEISESTPPMFQMSPGATLKNLQLECALDGIHTTRNNKIENVLFRDVEEDAITVLDNVTISNSEFWFCNDKCIQMNRAQNAKITGNTFHYVGGTAVLANYGYNISVEGNNLYQAKRGIRSRTNKSLIRASGNIQEGGSCFLIAEDKGILEDLGQNSATKTSKVYCEVNGGKIIKK